METVVVRAAIPMLRVTSVGTALPTYRALGFHVAWQHQLAPDAPRLTCVRHGPTELYLTEHPGAPAGAVVYLVVRGVDALVHAAAAAGVRPAFGPEDRPWGNREAYFHDPDGNVLRFGEPIPA